MARKAMNVFSLSFLDAMTCGFGAVILFFMIINANIDLRREDTLVDLASEVDRMELKVLTGRKNLVELKEDLVRMIEQWAFIRDRREQISGEIEAMEAEADALEADEATREEIIERLRAELEQLETETRRLADARSTPQVQGDRLRSFTGDGNRQYLTGLRMGGERVVILVDASTSMLDRTIVNIIRRRNMSALQQLRAPKWRQVVDTLDWLTTQIPPGTQIQIFAFNDTAWTLLDGTEGRWHTVVDGSLLDTAVAKLGDTVPAGPTSLHAAFAAMRPLDPRPDNIYLLVDGLPTMGEIPPNRAGVTGEERRGHLQRAVRELPFNVPVNVILYAMEGDPYAAPMYWELAISTGGSMMGPPRRTGHEEIPPRHRNGQPLLSRRGLLRFRRRRPAAGDRQDLRAHPAGREPCGTGGPDRQV